MVIIMSRSYKRYPVVKIEKVDKQVWNRMVRNYKVDYALRHAQYKKIHTNYDDWKYRWSLDNAIDDYYRKDYIRKQYKLDVWIDYWKKCCLRK